MVDIASTNPEAAAIEEFLSRLTDMHRPSVLFLGQRASMTEEGVDQLLGAIRNRYNIDEDVPYNYDILFKIDASGDYRAVAEWLAERSRNQPFSETLAVIARHAWNAVFTSSVCPLVGRAFRSPGRIPQDIAAANQIPDTPQSRTRLAISWLFGRLDEEIGSDRAAPISGRLSFRQRKLTASSFLSRIPTVVSNYGTLIIEKFDPQNDWISDDDIVAVVSNLHPGQAHWFSWPKGRAPDGEVAELVRDGRLALYETSLADVLLEADAGGLLSEMVSEFDDFSVRTALLGGKRVGIPRSLLARADAIGRIIESTPPRGVPLLDHDAEQGLLREFLRDPIGSGMVWEAVQWGFVVPRRHDKPLNDGVRKAIGDLAKRRRPVLLMGPSGSGRSVSLANLAVQAAAKLNAVVYFVDGSNAPPDELLEDLARFSSSNNGDTAILVWDGNRTPTEYQRLVDSAYSRGDKLVVVGSCYPGRRVRGDHENIEALPRLDDKEQTDFANLLRRFGLSLNTQSFSYDRLLVLLYRYVQIARPQLGAALSSEAEHYSRDLKQKLRALHPKTPPMGALAAALVEAGLVSSADWPDAVAGLPSWQRSEADELIAATMAVGRHGLTIPLDLAVRTCVHSRDILSTWSQVEHILKDTDIVEVRSDADGVVRIGPRHQVEARILADRELGGPKAEIELYARLVESARPGAGLGAASDPEMRFLIDLCVTIGPNGQDEVVRSRYRLFYGILASALRNRRKTAPLNTELALQEAVMWREHMISSEEDDFHASNNALQNLEDAIELLDQSIDAVRKEGRRWRHLRNLRVERTTLIGSLTVQLVGRGAGREELMARVQQVQAESIKISDSDPTFYYPRDVMLWTMSDALRAPALTLEDQAKLQADLRNALFEVREDDLPVDQLEKFLERKRKVGVVLADRSLSEQALLRLREMGSNLPDRLAALELAGEILTRESPNAGDEERLVKAINLLAPLYDKSKLDTNGLRLLLRIYWRAITGKNLFASERAPTPVNSEDIRFCKNMVRDLVLGAAGDPPQQFLFLMAVLAWIDGEYTLSRDAWQQLEQISDRGTSYRIRKHLVMHQTRERPASFRGRIVSTKPDGRAGRVRLEENGQHVHISAADFRVHSLRRDENIELRVAFNYLGPVAIPAV